MSKLLIATNNAHKLAEYREIFSDIPLAFTSPDAEGLSLDPKETGNTFVANAKIKALAFAAASGLPVMADDSGLEVDALNGAPGIYSARYGNTAKDDHQGRYQLLLRQLAEKNVPWDERTARFRCVIVVAMDNTVIGTADGTVEGFIDYKPKGVHGFGYDPVFFVPEFDKTMAELPPAVKHSISHRGRAARAAIPIIEELLKAD